MSSKSAGFTIVELLIVIVVIGVLAAITIVAYNGVQERSRVTVLQSDLVSAKKKLMLYQVDQGKFPASPSTLLASVGITATKSVYDVSAATVANFYYCYNKTSDRFAMGARTIGMTAYLITSDGPLQQATTGVSVDITCQTIGLSGWTDPNAYAANGYLNSAGWSSWVNG